MLSVQLIFRLLVSRSPMIQFFIHVNYHGFKELSNFFNAYGFTVAIFVYV